MASEESIVKSVEELVDVMEWMMKSIKSLVIANAMSIISPVVIAMVAAMMIGASTMVLLLGGLVIAGVVFLLWPMIKMAQKKKLNSSERKMALFVLEHGAVLSGVSIGLAFVILIASRMIGSSAKNTFRGMRI